MRKATGVAHWVGTVGLGTVHVVNPADPGSSAFADVYREFFDDTSEDLSGSSPQREPAVYGKDGTPLGAVTYRLPQNASRYFAQLKPGDGRWVRSPESRIELVRSSATFPRWRPRR